MNTYKLHPLNTKAIRKSLTVEGVKVVSCYKGKGTTKNATYITVSSNDAEKAVIFLNNIGVVSSVNKPLLKLKSSSSTYDLGACYMSNETY